MLSKDDRDQIKHIYEALDKEIEVKEKEIKGIRETRGKLSKYIYGKEDFGCPIKKSNYDAICPKCDEILPEVSLGWTGKSSKNFYSFPYGAEEEIINKVKFKTEGCKEWKKKRHTAICGCGGIMWCECGYCEEYCWSDKRSCLYCGRELQHKKYKPFDFNLEQIKSKEK